MYKKISLAILLMIIWFGISYALQPNRGLLGDVDGYLILTSEDDTLDPDQTVYRSEFSLWRDIQVNTVKLEPYYYFKNESLADSLNVSQLTENMLGIDLVIQESELEKIYTGIGYKYRYKSTGDNTDGLFVTRFKMEF